MQYADKVTQALEFLKKKIGVKPDVGIVLGSGLGKLAESAEDALVIPYSDIPYWPHSTAPGHAGKLVIGTLAGHTAAIMQGRVHYYEGYMMEEVTFPTRVLAELGVKTLIATNASGGINTDIQPGTIVAITDHINYMGTNPLIGENNDSWGARFPDMSEAYDRDLIEALTRVAAMEGIRLERGVYIAFSGPSFETPAEIRMARILGADLVGMSTVPEVIVANHMGLKVCGISCVANFAAGITQNRLTHQEVLDTMNMASGSICGLITALLREVKP